MCNMVEFVDPFMPSLVCPGGEIVVEPGQIDGASEIVAAVSFCLTEI